MHSYVETLCFEVNTDLERCHLKIHDRSGPHKHKLACHITGKRNVTRAIKKLAKSGDWVLNSGRGTYYHASVTGKYIHFEEYETSGLDQNITPQLEMLKRKYFLHGACYSNNFGSLPKLQKALEFLDYVLNRSNQGQNSL